MYFVIFGRDDPGTAARRAEARPAHLERLEALNTQGRLLLAGPMPRPGALDADVPEMLGSLIVAEFPSLEDAREWAARDPYVAAGVYSEVQVYPFRKVLP